MNLRRTNIEDLDFYFIKGDKNVGERIALEKYETFESSLIKHISKEPGVAVDVGANIGYYTLILSKIFSGVVAIEPEPVNFQVLKKNIEANKIQNARILQKAVSDKNESNSLGLSKDNLGDHQINSLEAGRKNITVKSITLDSVVKERISLLKIDTQGWEPKVVLGAKKVITRDLPCIFMEFWPEGYKRSSLDFMKMIHFLEKKYGKIYLIDDYLGLVYPVRADSLIQRCNTRKGYLDLLFKKKASFLDRWLFLKRFNVKHLIKQLLGL